MFGRDRRLAKSCIDPREGLRTFKSIGLPGYKSLQNAPCLLQLTGIQPKLAETKINDRKTGIELPRFYKVSFRSLPLGVQAVELGTFQIQTWRRVLLDLLGDLHDLFVETVVGADRGRREERDEKQTGHKKWF